MKVGDSKSVAYRTSPRAAVGLTTLARINPTMAYKDRQSGHAHPQLLLVILAITLAREHEGLTKRGVPGALGLPSIPQGAQLFGAHLKRATGVVLLGTDILGET